MTEPNKSTLLKRLKLIGQPYWFGATQWTWYEIVGVLAITGLVVWGLNVGVRVGAEYILDNFKKLDSSWVLTSFPTFAKYLVPCIAAMISGYWYYLRTQQNKEETVRIGDQRGSRYTGWLLLSAVLVFMVLVNILNVTISDVARTFTTALNQKNETVYWKYLYLYASIFVIATPIVVYNTWFKRILFVHWRRWLTHYLLDKYFGNDRAFYRINGRPDIDNPDERIHQDVQNFVDGALSLMLTLLGSLITLVAFVGMLWSMSHLLTWSVIAYATIGTVLTMLAGRVLVSRNALQLRYEADFRFGITHVRNNAESIAFYNGQDHENEQIQQSFQKLYNNYLRLLAVQRNLQFFTTGFDYAVIIIPSLFLVPMFFRGEVEIGIVTQATMAFRQILGSLAVVVDSFPTITLFAANVHRLGGFVEALDKQARLPGQERIVIKQGSCIEFNGVTVKSPDEKLTLVQNLNLKLESGQSLMIVGPSGAGKTTILRVLCGLSDHGSGTLTLPVDPLAAPDMKEMFFLSQKPYMVVKGTLRQQLLYPKRDAEVANEALRQILNTVNLPDFEQRFEGGFDAVPERPWGEVVSPGQQQRLAFGRLLLAAPKLAFLDEATSSMDAKNEAHVYEGLRDTGTQRVTVAHRLSLVKYHDLVLELKGDGAWEVMSAQEYITRQRSE